MLVATVMTERTHAPTLAIMSDGETVAPLIRPETVWIEDRTMMQMWSGPAVHETACLLVGNELI